MCHHFYNPTFIIFLASRRELRKLQSHHSFKSFVIQHKKEYETIEEYQKRFEIFKENMLKVRFLRETEQGTGIYGPTFFSDLTEEEFKERHLGFYPRKYNPVSNTFETELTEVHSTTSNEDLPESFDWRTHGAVTPVKNQGKYFKKNFFFNQIVCFHGIFLI